MTAADFMLMELQEEQDRVFNVLDNERLAFFLRGEYELEEGEVLPGLHLFSFQTPILYNNETYIKTKLKIYIYT